MKYSKVAALTLFAVAMSACAELRHQGQTAKQNDHNWILGTWRHEMPHHGGRTVVFHPDQSWGVLGYVPDREDIRGRRWRIEGEQLIRTYPDDNGFRTISDQIVSFSSERFELDDNETFLREH